MAAVEEVDEEAEDQPDEEAVPGDDGQSGHEQEAEDDAERGNDGAAGNNKAAMADRLAEAKNDDADGDEDEGEKGADVGEVGEGADVEQARGNGDHEAGDPGGERGRAEEGMDAGEDAGQEAVAGHGEPDPGLADLVDEDGGDHSHERAEQDDEADPVERAAAGENGELLEGVDDGRGVAHHGPPGNEAGETDGDSDIEHRADDERGDDADGQIALRVAALFGGGGDGVEADVGEKDDGTAGENSRPAVGHEGMPVRGMNEADDGEDEDEDGDELERDHHVVGGSRLADAADEDDGEDHDDEEGGDIEAEMPAGIVEGVAGQVLEAAGKIGG